MEETIQVEKDVEGISLKEFAKKLNCFDLFGDSYIIDLKNSKQIEIDKIYETNQNLIEKQEEKAAIITFLNPKQPTNMVDYNICNHNILSYCDKNKNVYIFDSENMRDYKFYISFGNNNNRYEPIKINNSDNIIYYIKCHQQDSKQEDQGGDNNKYFNRAGSCLVNCLVNLSIIKEKGINIFLNENNSEELSELYISGILKINKLFKNNISIGNGINIKDIIQNQTMFGATRDALVYYLNSHRKKIRSEKIIKESIEYIKNQKEELEKEVKEGKGEKCEELKSTIERNESECNFIKDLITDVNTQRQREAEQKHVDRLKKAREQKSQTFVEKLEKETKESRKGLDNRPAFDNRTYHIKRTKNDNKPKWYLDR